MRQPRRLPPLLALLVFLLAPGSAPAQEPGIVAFEAVVAALQSDDPSTRSAAARELAFQGRPEAVPHLLAALRRPEPSPWVRQDIYGALGALGDVAALPALTDCLEEETREELLATCVAALGQIGDPAALPWLLTLAGPDGPATLRLRAIEALGLIDDARAREALIAFLDDPETAVRMRAAAALAHHGGDAALAALVAALAAAETGEEQAALARALGRLGPDAAEAVPRIARLLAADRPSYLRKVAVEALSRIGGSEAVAALVSLLGDRYVEIDRLVVEALGTMEDPIAAGPLLARFALGLGAFHRATDEALLADAARWEGELETLAAAVRALSRLPPLGGVGHLQQAAVGRPMPGGSAWALALKDAHYRLRQVSLEALGLLPHGEALEFLAAYAAEPAGDPRLRGTAARALGEAGGRTTDDAAQAMAERVLEGLLLDPEREVRWSACAGLATLGDPAAIPALQLVAEQDPDALVQRAAAEAATALAE